MKELYEGGVTPNGQGGLIKKYDPESKSFKEALISVVFTVAWLESLTYNLIVARDGEGVFKKYNHKTLEERLRFFFGKNIPKNLLRRVEKLRCVFSANWPPILMLTGHPISC